jgi:hypothetical protein
VVVEKRRVVVTADGDVGMMGAVAMDGSEETRVEEGGARMGWGVDMVVLEEGRAVVIVDGSGWRSRKGGWYRHMVA